MEQIQFKRNNKCPSRSFNKTRLYQKISIYPNPVVSYLIVKSQSYDEQLEIVIYDIQGKEVLRNIHNNNETKINIESFSQGIYFVKVFDSSGTIHETKIAVTK